jgi:hypothetical protein
MTSFLRNLPDDPDEYFFHFPTRTVSFVAARD